MDYTTGDLPAQSKLYDKIVKENMLKVLPELVKNVLGINVMHREDLSESLQHTKETVPDQLSKITDDKGNTFILHIEWQSEDDPSMDHRMLNYRAMLRQKYRLAVKQYVIFLAREKSTMPHSIDEENLKFSYHLIPLQKYSHEVFLKSELPEQKLLAIFGNFDNEPPIEVIKKILHGIEQQADGELSVQRYRQQLRALIQLRKLGKEFEIAMGTITKFKVEKDPFYIRGRNEANHDVVENLIEQFGFSDEQAANAAEVSISFVKKVRKELEARK